MGGDGEKPHNDRAQRNGNYREIVNDILCQMDKPKSLHT